MAEDKDREAADISGRSGRPMAEAEIDLNLMGSFPASDPPSWTLGTDHPIEPAVSMADQLARNRKTVTFGPD